MPLDPRLLDWTQRFSGLDPDRCESACETILSWGIEHVTAEFVERRDIDAVVGAVLLAEAVQTLQDRGVPESKLLAKLRNDPDCWPTWCELRAAEIVAVSEGEDVEVDLDPGRSKGSHPDFRIRIPESDLGAAIEVKAVGLSDQEVGFLREAAPIMSRVCPRAGLATLHAQLGQQLVAPSRAERRRGERHTRKRMAKLPPHAREFAGVQVVGHSAEPNYLRRVKYRLEDALSQLPEDSPESWVAVFWSNGAPSRFVASLMTEIEAPANVVGVILVSSAIVFPDPEIHNYCAAVPREDVREAEQTVVSLEDHPLGAPVLERIETSSGIRAVLLQDPETSEALLMRDGSRRLFPCNVLLDDDPPEVRAQIRQGIRVTSMDLAEFENEEPEETVA